MKVMEGKVCVITGGAGSLGLASAAQLVGEGAKVLLVDREPAALASALERLGAGAAARVHAADATDAAATRAYLDAAVAAWGRIDFLFSNAGVSGVVRPVTDYPEDVFDQVMAVNVRASFLACKYGLPKMNDGGSIVITSSVVGVTSAAPSPWMARLMTRTSTLPAKPAASEAAVKIDRPIMNSRFRPQTSASRPPASNRLANTRM